MPQSVAQLKAKTASLKAGVASSSPASGLTFSQVLELIEEILEIVTPLVSPAPTPAPTPTPTPSS